MMFMAYLLLETSTSGMASAPAEEEGRGEKRGGEGGEEGRKWGRGEGREGARREDGGGGGETDLSLYVLRDQKECYRCMSI